VQRAIFRFKREEMSGERSVTECCQGDQIREVEIGRACGM
jgi:hypothetical protein